MKTIQIEGLEKNISKIVLADIQYIQENLNDVLRNSEKTIIENLIEETRFLIQQAQDNSRTKTYYDKYLVFDKINKLWFDLHKHYKDSIKMIDLIETINHLTNYSIAYSQLFISLSLINENRTDKYKQDLERIVSGFLLLSETIDIFIESFSISELEQINYGAENAICISSRNAIEYFEEDLELSHLVTNLRAYSSLILLRVERYMANTDSKQENNYNIDFQLREMANDSEIQLEIKSINEEFLMTEMDGLT